MFKRLLLHTVIGKIKKADNTEINEIAQAVTQRYQILFPDWDVTFLSLPKDPDERRKQLESAIDFLDKHHFEPA